MCIKSNEKYFSLTKRITALIRFISQLHVAIFTNITVNVEIFLHSNNSDSLFSALNWSDSVSTTRALGSEDPVEVIDAVDLVVEVDSEGDTIKTLIADAAAEAARVECFANGLEDTLHDQMTTDLTLLRGLLEARVEIILFTIDLSIHIVKCFASQCSATATANKTRSVVQIAHCLQENISLCSTRKYFSVTHLTSLSRPRHLLIARMTRSKEL